MPLVNDATSKVQVSHDITPKDINSKESSTSLPVKKVTNVTIANLLLERRTQLKPLTLQKSNTEQSYDTEFPKLTSSKEEVNLDFMSSKKNKIICPKKPLKPKGKNHQNFRIRAYKKPTESNYALPQAVMDKIQYFDDHAKSVKSILENSSKYDVANLDASLKKTIGRDVNQIHKNLSLIVHDNDIKSKNLKEELNLIADQICFTHETSTGNFKKIMTGDRLYSQTNLAQKLGPNSNVFKGLNDSIKGGGNFVYTRLVTKGSAQKMDTDHLVGGRGKYMFLFKGDLIKARASYANPVDGKGLIPTPQTTGGAESAIAHNVLAYKTCIKSHSCNNEVGFHGEIPFNMLSNIVVKAENHERTEQLKKLTIKELEPKREQLESITGKPLEDLVVVKRNNDIRYSLLNLTKG